MKRTRLLFAALFLGAVSFVPAGLAAQDVMIGVKGGINIADVDVEDAGEDVDSDTRTGFVGGVFAELGLGGLFAIRPEGLYSQKGFSAEDQGVEFELKLNYIEVPVLLAARLSRSAIRPVLFAGPVIAFETSCKVSDSVSDESVDCADLDPEDPLETESTDFGVAFGGGVEMDMGGAVLLLDGRYTLGLRDVEASDASEAKNRAWSIMAGVGFHP